MKYVLLILFFWSSLAFGQKPNELKTCSKDGKYTFVVNAKNNLEVWKINANHAEILQIITKEEGFDFEQIPDAVMFCCKKNNLMIISNKEQKILVFEVKETGFLNLKDRQNMEKLF